MFRYLFLMINQIITHKPTRLFMILGAFFAANAIIAEIVGVKIFSLEDTLGIARAHFGLFGEKDLSFSLTVGVLPWPVVFVMTDIINEYYGVKGVRFLTLLTVALIGFAFLYSILPSMLLPIPATGSVLVLPRVCQTCRPHSMPSLARA